MLNGHSNLAAILSEWVFPIIALVATITITTTTRALLKRLHKDHNLPFLRELAPTISNILYILGLKLFADVAPLSGKVESWLDGGIYVFAVVIFLNLFRQTALLAMKWGTLKANHSQTLELGFIPLVRNIITLFSFLSGGIMILKHFNYDVMSLLTALGVGSLAVGLAAKDTLSNMISGFILIIDRNLRPGDRINLAGSIGDVTEIGLRSTQIRILDGNTLIVPNSDLVNTKILNLSLPNREIVCTTQIRIPYSIPFHRAKSICLDALNQVEKTSKQRSAWVNLVSLAEGHQLIQIGFWISELNDSGAAHSDFHERLLAQLTEDQIPLLPPVTLR